MRRRGIQYYALALMLYCMKFSNIITLNDVSRLFEISKSQASLILKKLSQSLPNIFKSLRTGSYSGIYQIDKEEVKKLISNPEELIKLLNSL